MKQWPVSDVTTAPVVSLYARPDDTIRDDVVNDVLRGPWIEPSTVDVQVSAGVVCLTGTR